MEKEYKIEIHSIVRFIVAMILILVSSTFLILDNLPKPDVEIISVVQFFAVFAISFYLAYQAGKGKAKLVFTKEGIQHIWEQRFFLSWEKNYFIPWNLVDNYVFQEDRTFDSFIINLTNKTRYKINRMNVLPIKDDFKQLVKDFPRLSNEFKKGLVSDSKIQPIREGESIYVSKSFHYFFYFLLIGFIILLLTKLFTSDSGATWGSLGIIGSAVLFYGTMVFIQKKKG